MSYQEWVIITRRVISKSLYNYRAEHGMGMNDMSKALGVSVKTYYRWERMKNTMEIEMMLLINEKIGVNLLDIILKETS